MKFERLLDWRTFYWGWGWHVCKHEVEDPSYLTIHLGPLHLCFWRQP